MKRSRQCERGFSHGLTHLDLPKALVVDDDPVMVHLVYSMLQRIGFRTDKAGDGLTAIGLLDCFRYDLVITDLTMPLVSGYELAKLIKEKYEKTVVIMITGSTLKEVTARGIYPGPLDAWVFKPSGYKEFINLVIKIVPCFGKKLA